MDLNTIYNGDSLEILKSFPDESIKGCCVTSPPYYGLRDYGVDGQIGLEETPEQYIEKLVNVFREVRRVLTNDSTLWVNIGDSYAGSGKGAWSVKDVQKEVYVPVPGSAQTKLPKTWDGIKAKDMIGIPWMLAFALRADGWFLRQDIIWHKPNAMPESVTDRCTKSHEYLFLLSKSPRYYFNNESIKEKAVCGTDMGILRSRGAGGEDSDKVAWHAKTIKERQDKGIDSRTANASGMRNKRDVWSINTKPFKEAHFAVFPEDLVTPCVLAGCPEDGVVLDPFFGSGTSGVVAKKLGRKFIGIELNPTYCDIAERRLLNVAPA